MSNEEKANSIETLNTTKTSTYMLRRILYQYYRWWSNYTCPSKKSNIVSYKNARKKNERKKESDNLLLANTLYNHKSCNAWIINVYVFRCMRNESKESRGWFLEEKTKTKKICKKATVNVNWCANVCSQLRSNFDRMQT